MPRVFPDESEELLFRDRLGGVGVTPCLQAHLHVLRMGIRGQCDDWSRRPPLSFDCANGSSRG